MPRASTLQAHHSAVLSQDAGGHCISDQLDALGLGLFQFPLVGRDLAPRATVDQVDLFCSQAQGSGGHIHGGDPTAHYGHLFADAGWPAQVDLSQEGNARQNPWQVLSLDAQPRLAGDAGGQEDGIVALVQELARIADRAVQAELHPQAQDVVNVSLQDTFGQAMFGDAHAHHPSGHRQGFKDGHFVAQPDQVMSGGQARRP